MIENDDMKRFHARLFWLQSAARKVWSTKRVCACCKVAVPRRSVQIWGDIKRRLAKYRNVLRCKSLWLCPVCANNITAHRRGEIEKAISAFYKEYTPVMLSFTVRHQRNDTLFDTLRTLSDAWRGMTKGKAWSKIAVDTGMRGMIRTFEVTWSERNGWHPHYHVLIFVSKTKMNKLSAVYKKIRERWQMKVTDAGGESDIRYACSLTTTDNSIAAYMAKWCHEPLTATRERLSRWGMAAEMTRGIVKEANAKGLTPFDMLELSMTCKRPGHAFWAKLLREYSEAVEGTRQITWSRGLKDAAGISDVDDGEIVEGIDAGYELLATIGHSDWKAITYTDMQGVILDCAARGDEAMMRAIIRDCVVEYLAREERKMADYEDIKRVDELLDSSL